ncbi:histamine H1 receptor isoform X3 [Excalfactoria chinensis]|uniref:histamine H1 receptor isoform X3 n=1 Tax=Excalfactoria chinensis TaxID=46218 RepID=UPI003B3AD681
MVRIPGNDASPPAPGWADPTPGYFSGYLRPRPALIRGGKCRKQSCSAGARPFTAGAGRTKEDPRDGPVLSKGEPYSAQGRTAASSAAPRQDRASHPRRAARKKRTPVSPCDFSCP